MKKLCQQKPLGKESQMAYEQYIKDCNTKSLRPENAFVSIIKSTDLLFNLDDFNIKTNKQELKLKCRIISKYSYWNKLIIYGQNTSTNSNIKQQCKNHNKVLFIQEESNKSNQLLLMKNISTHIAMSHQLAHIEISNFKLNHSLSHILSQGISINHSIFIIKIVHCSFDSPKDSNEILFAIANNSNIIQSDIIACALRDTSSHSLSQIVSCHTHYNQGNQWEMNLRDNHELFTNPFYLNGLQIINLNHNYLESNAAKAISQALINDTYIHSIDLSSNHFSESDCGLFIVMLRTNTALINCDLRYNPGYSFKTHARIALKLCRNIKKIKEEYLNQNISKEEYNALRAFANAELFQINTLNNGSHFDGNDVTFALKNNTFTGVNRLRTGLSLQCINYDNEKKIKEQLELLTNENEKLKKEVRTLNKRFKSNSHIIFHNENNSNYNSSNKRNASFSISMTNEKDKEHKSHNIKQIR